MEEELVIFSEFITNIDKLFPEEVKKIYDCKIETKEIIKQLISFIQNGISKNVNLKSMIFILKVFE